MAKAIGYRYNRARPFSRVGGWVCHEALRGRGWEKQVTYRSTISPFSFSIAADVFLRLRKDRSGKENFVRCGSLGVVNS